MQRMLIKKSLDNLNEDTTKADFQEKFYNEIFNIISEFMEEPNFDDSHTLRELMDEYNSFVTQKEGNDEYIEVEDITDYGLSILRPKSECPSCKSKNIIPSKIIRKKIPIGGKCKDCGILYSLNFKTMNYEAIEPL